MKKLLVFFIITVLINCSLAYAQKKSNSNSYNVKSKVNNPRRNEQDTVRGGFKLCTVYVYEFINSREDLSSRSMRSAYRYNMEGNKIVESHYGCNGCFYGPEGSICTVTFDDKGNIIEDVNYNPDGSIEGGRKHKIKYDRRGNEIENTRFELNKSGKTEKKESDVYLFDSHGKLVENITYCYNNDSDRYICQKRKVKYNSHGQEIEEATERFTQYDYWKSAYSYDNKGNVIEIIYQSIKGGYNAKDRYKYDDRGNKIEWLQLNLNDSLLWKSIYTFDNHGNEIEEIRYGHDSTLVYKKISKYDSNGNEIEVVEYRSDMSIKTHITNKYDDNGNNIEWNLLEYDIFSVERSVHLPRKFVKKYDEYGNCIEKIEYSLANIPQSKIEYIYSK